MEHRSDSGVWLEVFFRSKLYFVSKYGRGFVWERRWLSLGTSDAVEVPIYMFELGFVKERQDCSYAPLIPVADSIRVELILPCQRASFSGDVVECLS
jgi:hypothetical protein